MVIFLLFNGARTSRFRLVHTFGLYDIFGPMHQGTL